MDVCDVALVAVAGLIDQTTWRREGRLWIPPTPIEIEDLRAVADEEDVDVEDMDLGDPAAALMVAFSLACDPARQPAVCDLVMFLQWARGFLDSASFVRVSLTPEWSAYRGIESSFEMNRWLAATSQPGPEADREFLDFVFDQGGKAANFEFIVAPPSNIVYPPAYSLDDLVRWITQGIAPHPEAITEVLDELGLGESLDPYEETLPIASIEDLVRRYLIECADLTRSATAYS